MQKYFLCEKTSSLNWQLIKIFQRHLNADRCLFAVGGRHQLLVRFDAGIVVITPPWENKFANYFSKFFKRFLLIFTSHKAEKF